MTRRMSPYGLTLVFGTLVFTEVTLAQSDSWERLQLVPAGRTVEVQERAGKRVSGTLESWSPDSIRLRNRKGIQAFDRNGVTSVVMVTGRSRGKKAAVAAAATAVSIGVIAAITCGTHQCDGTGNLAWSLPLWSGAAGGIAALFPPHREAVYRSEALGSGAKPAGAKRFARQTGGRE